MRVIEAVAGWDRFKLYEHRNGFLVRWWDRKQANPQRSHSLQASCLEQAREEALDFIIDLIRPEELISDRQDPTVGEIWMAYQNSRAGESVQRRQELLKSRWMNYYADRFSDLRCSEVEGELKAFRDDLAKHGTPWRNGKPEAIGKLSPNTQQEIVDVIRAAVNFAINKYYARGVATVDRVKVAGFQKPIDRQQKGRYLSFAEIGALIDAMRSSHLLHLTLIEAGVAARIGSLLELEDQQVNLTTGVIDLLKPGESQTRKPKGRVPISGPL